MTSQPLLRLEGVKLSYVAPDEGRVEVLDVPGFELAADEHVALRGSSGAGRATLLHIVACIVKPDAGEVVVAGAEVAKLSKAAHDH